MNFFPSNKALFFIFKKHQNKLFCILLTIGVIFFKHSYFSWHKFNISNYLKIVMEFWLIKKMSWSLGTNNQDFITILVFVLLLIIDERDIFLVLKSAYSFLILYACIFITIGGILCIHLQNSAYLVVNVKMLTIYYANTK